ncbi:hypothetical protein H0O01_00830 [Candidatus Micrarchaeota archaeon]|nr:hypothetical protein [Candidatus Micrarchaeota archaeon]
MASVTKPAETPVGKASGAEVIRPSGELCLRRISGGGSSMKVVLEAAIMRYGPNRRIENTFGCEEDEIRDAARSVAKCWIANGLKEKALALIKTYGLDAEEVARSSSLPPQPKKG